MPGQAGVDRKSKEEQGVLTCVALSPQSFDLKYTESLLDRLRGQTGGRHNTVCEMLSEKAGIILQNNQILQDESGIIDKKVTTDTDFEFFTWLI